jgi:hypothetical protein
MKLTQHGIQPTATSFRRCGVALAVLLGAAQTNATERIFTYTYEPETMIQGSAEVEQWVTLRAGKNSTVGKDNYNRWDLRTELEYGVTDNYTIGFYVLQFESQSYEDTTVSPAVSVSEFEWKGVALENRYMILNPAEHAIGLTAYLEGGYSGSEAFIEPKIIIGQRHGEWKWAANFIYENEWEDDLSEVEGVIAGTAGIARNLGSQWTVGLEIRNVNKWPDYSGFSSSALYVGPAISYRKERFWAALSILPQVWGYNYEGNPDGDTGRDLADNEALLIRLILAFDL